MRAGQKRAWRPVSASHLKVSAATLDTFSVRAQVLGAAPTKAPELPADFVPSTEEADEESLTHSAAQPVEMDDALVAKRNMHVRLPHLDEWPDEERSRSRSHNVAARKPAAAAAAAVDKVQNQPTASEHSAGNGHATAASRVCHADSAAAAESASVAAMQEVLITQRLELQRLSAVVGQLADVDATKLNEVRLAAQAVLSRERERFAADKEDSGEDGSEGVSNLYSYCVMAMIEGRSVRRLLWACSTLVLLVGMQQLLAFGFWDASMMLRLQQFIFVTYRDPVDPSVLYASSRLFGSTLPTLNGLVAIVAIVLLACIMKVDNQGTLKTHQAMTEQAANGGQPADTGCVRAMRYLFWLPLLASDVTRSVLFPCCAAHGSALAFSNAGSAQEIVLNSVAIGFVFEVDAPTHPHSGHGGAVATPVSHIELY